jgi:hypothetical protein
MTQHSASELRAIPGVPEGWELVRIGGGVTAKVDWIVSSHGLPILCSLSDSANQNYVVIRKIEKPARYRPFANAAEFKPHRDRWLTRIDENGQQIDGEFQLDGFDDTGIWLGANPLSYRDALDRGHTFDDGTPFGVKIDE